MENANKKKIRISDWMLLSSAFSMLLLAVRVIITDELTYAFLAWNLLLAYVPYWLSLKFKTMQGQQAKLFAKWAVLLGWVVFMPNSFYILTDLYHLDDMHSTVIWFDLTMILSFAWNGVLCGILSLYRMESILRSGRRKALTPFLICFVMWLNAFGVYLGRSLRFNSWDVITNPLALVDDIFQMVINPGEYMYVWGMTACFSVLMLIIYYTVRAAGREIRRF